MGTALAVIETVSAIEFFAPGACIKPLENLKAEVRGMAAKLDISTRQGRADIASLAAKVSKTKTALDGAGKELVEEKKRALALVDKERKYMRDELDALRDEVRKPLTDWEEADAKRVASLEFQVVCMAELGVLPYGATTADIKARLAQVEAADISNMQEFTSRMELAAKTTAEALSKALIEAEKRDTEVAEMARLRAEALAREQKERDERVAKEAREKAQREAEVERKRIEEEKFAAEAKAKQAEAEKVEAEARAKREAEEAEKRHQEAIAAAARKAEEERVAAEAKAAKDAKEASDRAEMEKQAAIEAERKRAAEVAEQERLATEKREANRKHAARINNEVREALIAVVDDKGNGMLVSEPQATAIVTAIAKGLVAHTKISY